MNERMPSRSPRRAILTPRALTRGARSWQRRLHIFRQLRTSLLRPIRSLRGPRRFGRHDGDIARPRLSLRVVRQRLTVRERMGQAPRRRIIKIISAPAGAQARVIRPRQTRIFNLQVVESPSGRASEASRRGHARHVRVSARDVRRIERLHVRTVRERLQVERIVEQSTARAHPNGSVARSRAPMSSGPPADSVPDGHRPQPRPDGESAHTAPLREVERLTSAHAPAPPPPPDIEDIAERVLRVIERRARAQRERLGSL